MNNPIRTLSRDDAEHFARNIHQRVVSGGRIQVDNLEWFSQALRNFEIERRNLHQSPDVDVYINELDLEIAFVTPRGQPSPRFKADSTLPTYCKGLSLYEHELVVHATKQADEAHKVDLQNDQQMVEALKAFRLAIAKCKDKRSAKKLVISAERLKLAQEQSLPKGDLNEAPADLPAVEAKRKRGRPRKQQSPVSTTQMAPSASMPTISVLPVARSREERLQSINSRI